MAFVLFSLLFYVRAFDNPFRQDDFAFLRYVQSVRLQDVFEPTSEFSFYRPGALALFALEHALFGENNGVYIVFNYLLHVAVSLGVWWVLRRTGLGAHGASLASGLFVLGVGHYGKQVMWASTSGPLASVALSLVALILMLGWLRSGRGPTIGRRFPPLAYPAGIFVALGIAPLFHEASLFTGLVLLTLVLTHGPKDRRGRIRYAVPALFALLIWVAILKVVSSAYPTYRAGWEAVGNVLVYFVRYLGFMVVPFQRTKMVSLPGRLDELAVTASYVQVGLGVAGVVVLVILMFRGNAVLRVLSAWLVLWLVPFTLVRMPESWLELRYLYFASIPFCGLLGYAFDVAVSPRGARLRRLYYVVLVGLVCVTAVLVILLERQYDRFHG